jgi:COP9 signalosome complex subunit 7
VKHLQLLKLFAYGTYREYLTQKNELLELTPIQEKKLKHLTLVSLATKTKARHFRPLYQPFNIITKIAVHSLL